MSRRTTTLLVASSLVLLAMPLAHAQSVSALAGATFPLFGSYCANANPGVFAGGPGYASADLGTGVSCGSPGGVQYGFANASGSWVTGDFSASATATANAGSSGAAGTNTFTDVGVVTLPAGMSSASVTFGLSGMSGTISAGPAASEGGGSAYGDAVLSMSDGGSSATSEGCLSTDGYCEGVLGVALSGAVPVTPITLTVHSGDTLQLSLTVEAVATASAVLSPESGAVAIAIDPVYLTLPAGATFASGVTGFLSGSPVPLPSPALLAVSGLLGLWLLRYAAAPSTRGYLGRRPRLDGAAA